MSEAMNAETTEARILDRDEAGTYATRWDEIQTRFVDEPRQAVLDADALVADTITSITNRLDDHRARLEERWNAGEEPDTEDLRQLLQRYRDFFGRLLNV